MFICKNCGIEKSADQYRVHKRGHRIGKCKSCENEYQRAYYAKQGDDVRERKRKQMNAMRAANPEANRLKFKAWRAANHEREKAKLREYHAKRFFWSRAMKLRGIGRATYKDLASLWRSQCGLCALTGRRLDRTAEPDHIIPKAKGGSDCKSNLRWVCKEVNRMKRDMMDEEFIAMCADVMQLIGQRIKMVSEI